MLPYDQEQLNAIRTPCGLGAGFKTLPSPFVKSWSGTRGVRRWFTNKAHEYIMNYRWNVLDHLVTLETKNGERFVLGQPYTDGFGEDVHKHLSGLNKFNIGYIIVGNCPHTNNPGVIFYHTP